MNVLITGTDSGFGRAVALEFLNTGASVYGIDSRFNNKLKNYEDYHHLLQDLTGLDELGDQLNDFLAGVKTLDLVILNSDMQPEINDLRETTIEKITTVMNNNVWANKVIIDTLIERVPNIYQVVAISSGAAINCARGWNAYAISKAALNTLMKLYAREIPETHFSALEPGITDTDPRENISPLNGSNSYPVVRKLKGIHRDLNITYPEYAANYLVEAMGIVLQEESGSYKDVRDILFSPGMVR